MPPAGPSDAVTDGRPLWVAGVTASEFHHRLTTRTAPARTRVQRVATFINRGEPALRREILALADRALAGQWILPGTEGKPAFICNPPAWSTPRHANEEYLWSLNRMPQWKPLLEAYTLTGEDRYAEKVVAELDDWIARVHPAPVFFRADGSVNVDSLSNSAPAPWRSLELGIRLFETWPRVLDHLAGTRHLPPERLERMVRSMAVQAEGLAVVTPVMWPAADHNHYFMEMLGLLSASVRCPELGQATAWREQALRELQRCVRTQFTADGGHVEGCPMYHNVCVVLLARFLLLAEAAGATLPPDIPALGTAAAWHSVHATRPSGQTVPWGDSSPHTYYDAPAVWTYRVSGDLAPLQHVGLMVGPEKLREMCLEAVWEIDDPADFYARMVQPPPEFAPLDRHDRGNDQVMARSGWGGDARSVFFACHSPLHPGSGHQHVDLGGFDFYGFGRALVADPGPFTYRECDDRRIFKSARYHSVLTVDGREPFEYLSRWRYGPQHPGRVTAMRSEAGLTWIASMHLSYEPVICQRVLALVEARMLVVIDRVANLGPGSTRQIYFHLDAPQAQVTWDVAGKVVRSTHGDVELALYSSGGLECAFLPGRVSEGWETTHPSTRVCLTDRGGTEVRLHAAVLVPWRLGEMAPEISGLALTEGGRQCVFRLDGRDYRIDAPGA